MLSDTKQNLLEQLVSNASFEELIYAKGYLAGYIAKIWRRKFYATEIFCFGKCKTFNRLRY